MTIEYLFFTIIKWFFSSSFFTKKGGLRKSVFAALGTEKRKGFVFFFSSVAERSKGMCKTIKKPEEMTVQEKEFVLSFRKKRPDKKTSAFKKMSEEFLVRFGRKISLQAVIRLFRKRRKQKKRKENQENNNSRKKSGFVHKGFLIRL